MASIRTKQIKKLGRTVCMHLCYRRSMIDACVFILMYTVKTKVCIALHIGCANHRTL